VLIHGDQDYLADAVPVAGDDAIDAKWSTRADMAQLDMFDVHIRHIDRALQLIEP
jgi:hypothetical protein